MCVTLRRQLKAEEYKNRSRTFPGRTCFSAGDERRCGKGGDGGGEKNKSLDKAIESPSAKTLRRGQPPFSCCN